MCQVSNCCVVSWLVSSTCRPCSLKESSKRLLWTWFQSQWILSFTDFNPWTRSSFIFINGSDILNLNIFNWDERNSWLHEIWDVDVKFTFFVAEKDDEVKYRNLLSVAAIISGQIRGWVNYVIFSHHFRLVPHLDNETESQ